MQGLFDEFIAELKTKDAAQIKKELKEMEEEDKAAEKDGVDGDRVADSATLDDEKIFDYVISNPPYQIKVADNQSPPIYHKFIDAAIDTGHNQVFIVKDNWAKAYNDSNNKLHKWRTDLLASHNVKQVDFHNEDLFPSVSVSTTVIVADQDYHKDLVIDGVSVPYPGLDDPVFKPYESIVRSKTRGCGSMGDRVINYRHYATNRQALRDAKASSGSGDMKMLCFVDKERTTITVSSESIVKPECKTLLESKYKVAFADIRPWQQNEKQWYYTLGAKEMPGEGFSMIVFDSAEEVGNYIKYINTKLWLYCCKMSKTSQTSRNGGLQFIPDLGDYTYNNPDINWDNPLDPQLYNLFGLTEEEIAAIEG